MELMDGFSAAAAASGMSPEDVRALMRRRTVRIAQSVAAMAQLVPKNGPVLLLVNPEAGGVGAAAAAATATATAGAGSSSSSSSAAAPASIGMPVGSGAAPRAAVTSVAPPAVLVGGGGGRGGAGR